MDNLWSFVQVFIYIIVFMVLVELLALPEYIGRLLGKKSKSGSLEKRVKVLEEKMKKLESKSTES